MCHSGIRDACNDVRSNGSGISFCKKASAFVAHLLYIDSLIGRSRVSIINPEEGTDLHFFKRLSDCFHAFRCYIDDLTRSQFLIIGISEIDICETLKRNTVCIIFLSDDNRSASVTVTCRIDTFRSHDKQSHGTVHDRLYITDSFYNRILFADQGSNQFCGINLPGAHLLKMRMSIIINHVQK